MSCESAPELPCYWVVASIEICLDGEEGLLECDLAEVLGLDLGQVRELLSLLGVPPHELAAALPSLPSPQAIAAHLLECPGCSQEWEWEQVSAQMLRDLLTRTTHLSPPPSQLDDLHDRIRRALEISPG